MLFQRMSTLPLLPSRPSVLFSSLTGAQLDSSAVSTTSPQQLFQEEILPVYNVQYVWFPTPLPLPRLYPVLTTSSILCTPSVPLSTGMLERVWKRVNSLRPVRILQLLRRTTKRLVQRQQREKERRKTSARVKRF